MSFGMSIVLGLCFGVGLIFAGIQGRKLGFAAGVESERRAVVRYLAARAATRNPDELAKAIAAGRHEE